MGSVAKVTDAPAGPASPAALQFVAKAFRDYAADLQRYLMRRLRGAPSEASDLMQEVYIRLLQKGERVELIRDPRRYLTRMASRVLSESRRKVDRSRVTFDSEVAVDVVDPAIMSEELDLRRDLEAAFQSLAPGMKEVCKRVLLEGCSYEEAAGRTGLACNTVADYVKEARAAMKRFLADRRPG